MRLVFGDAMGKLRIRPSGGRFPVLVAIVAVGLAAATVRAAQLKLRVKAVNPRAVKQSKEIRVALPPRVATNNVISLGGLDLGYDVKNGCYFVHKRVELEAGQSAVFDVAIEDIWVMSEEDLDLLGNHAASMVAKLKGAPSHESAAALLEEIQRNLGEARERQTKYAIGGNVEPVEHINAYEANLRTVARVKKDIGHIENLVLGTGQDTGKLLGSSKIEADVKAPPSLAPHEYNEVIYEITVTNPSEDSVRTNKQFRLLLPEEIKVYDVLDPQDLGVGIDEETGGCYVFKSDIVLGAGEAKKYPIKIRDKWNVNAPRIRSLEGIVSNLYSRVTQREQYEGVESAVEKIVVELEAVRGLKVPEVVNEDYVAFFREQSRRLALMEQRVSRIESAMRPIEKTTRWGFKVKAPSMKTTWLIIYIILGFLAFFSVLFFLRWFGRGKGSS